MTDLKPQEIINELDKHVIGQHDAKRAVATALRNRWRRKFVDEEMRDEIIPHNILMIGPTGVGKTEIARRLAKLSKSPFIKVEATKFTEVGYVGRDVESIIRDLVESAVNQVRQDLYDKVKERAKKFAVQRIVDVMVGKNASEETKNKFTQRFYNHQLDDEEIEIKLSVKSKSNPMHSIDVPGGHLGVMNLGEILEKATGQQQSKIFKMKVKEAYESLIGEESAKIVDEEKIVKEAIQKTEEEGIVFLDEIDKIASSAVSGNSGGGRAAVSREGVQRDLLPLIEGTVVHTKRGPVKTNHILFIASGAFHITKPSDMLPELQGRLPVRVELQPLTEEDMVRILLEPKHNLPKQYQAMLAVDNAELVFQESGIRRIAEITTAMNLKVENIGARRLHTIMEKLLESVSFTATETPFVKIEIDAEYVDKNLSKYLNISNDNSRFIL